MKYEHYFYKRQMNRRI